MKYQTKGFKNGSFSTRFTRHELFTCSVVCFARITRPNSRGRLVRSAQRRIICRRTGWLAAVQNGKGREVRNNPVEGVRYIRRYTFADDKTRSELNSLRCHLAVAPSTVAASLSNFQNRLLLFGCLICFDQAAILLRQLVERYSNDFA